jgi:hypothetical protein
MPFKSKAQARFLFANEPKVAKEFASKTEDVKSLPEKLGGSRRKKKKSLARSNFEVRLLNVSGARG